MRGVYLLHFVPKFKHAGHYLGYADDISARVYDHEFGWSGAKLTVAATKAGCGLYLVRVWPEADRNFERRLKGRALQPDGTRSPHTGSLKRLCPVCKGEDLDTIVGSCLRTISHPTPIRLFGSATSVLTAEV